MDTALRIAIVFAIFVTIFFGACLFLWLKGRKAAEKGGKLILYLCFDFLYNDPKATKWGLFIYEI